MCEYFSFMVDSQGNVYAILGKDREEFLANNKNPDSHSEIAEFYGISEDECWKFDLNIKYEEWKNLLQGKALSTLKTLKDCYDGGKPLEELTIPIMQKIQEWLVNNEEAIVEAGKLKFAAERLKELVFGGDKWDRSFIIALNRARTLEQVIEELNLTKTKKGWGNYLYYSGSDEEKPIRIIFRDPSGLGNITHLAVQRWVHKYARFNKETEQVEIFEERRANIIPSSIPIKE